MRVRQRCQLRQALIPDSRPRLMGFQAIETMIARGEMVGVVVLIVIGIVLLALSPGKAAEMA